jgi:hypothetical protein
METSTNEIVTFAAGDLVRFRRRAGEKSVFVRIIEHLDGYRYRVRITKTGQHVNMSFRRLNPTFVRHIPLDVAD